MELQKAETDGKQVIILTHHAPTNFRSIHPDNDHIESPLAYGMNYASMESLLKKPLIGWFFGHTHHNTDFLLRSDEDRDWTVRIAANQQGYIMGYHKNKAPKDYADQKVIVFPNNHELNEDVEIVEFKEFRKYLVDKETLVPKGQIFKNIEASMKDDTEENDARCDSMCKIL